jgi:GT2 family glycosyltransferase
MQHVAVIIVNYRTPDLVLKNLEALNEEHRRLDNLLRVFVIDNRSEDGSVERLTAAIRGNGWTDWISFLPQDDNLGFAAGNNVALTEILKAPHDYPFVYFLNPDARIESGGLEAARNFLSHNQKAGIVGSRLVNPDGSNRYCAFRFPSAVSEFLRGAKTGVLSRLLSRWDISHPIGDSPVKVDWVSGAAFMVRRSVIEQVGLMDDGYFLYFDEVDFMRQIHKAGWEIWHCPESVVVHEAGSATQIKGGISQRGNMPDYWYHSWRRYFVKNHGRFGAAVAGSCWIAGEMIFRLKSGLFGREISPGDTQISHFWRLALKPAIARGLD